MLRGNTEVKGLACYAGGPWEQRAHFLPGSRVNKQGGQRGVTLQSLQVWLLCSWLAEGAWVCTFLGRLQPCESEES